VWQVFTLDLKHGTGSVVKGETDLKPDVTLIINDANFMKLTDGSLDPQAAFMGGKLKLKGNMGLAMKIGGFAVRWACGHVRVSE
jgi:putative sterol carrier protein